MPTISFTLDLPEELVESLGSRDELNAKALEALVLQLLREAQISQGLAARMLGVTRWDILQLMARHQIFSGPESAEEAKRDTEAARVDRLATASRAGS